MSEERPSLSQILAEEPITPRRSFEDAPMRLPRELPRRPKSPSQINRVQEEATLAMWRRLVTEKYGNNCPCCGATMDPRYGLPQTKTKGHTRGRTKTKVKNLVRFWVFICWKCNQDQKDETLTHWAYMLNQNRDWRASHVDELIRFMDKIGVDRRYI